MNTLAKLWFTTGLAICTMLSSLVLWGAIHHALRYDAPFNPRMLPFLSIAAILAFSFAMMVRKAQREYLHGALLMASQKRMRRSGLEFSSTTQ